MRSLLGWTVAIGLVGAAVLVGCSSGGSSLGSGNLPNNTTGGVTNNTGTVLYRVLNASPDIGNIDVYIDGTRTVSALKYGAFGPGNSPFYAALQPSNHQVTICLAAPAAGCPTANALSAATILSTSFRTTIVVVDQTAKTATAAAVLAPNALAFNEPFLSTPGSNATLVMHHAAPLSEGGIVAFGTYIPVPLSQPPSNLPTVKFVGTMNYSDPPLPASMAVLKNYTIPAGTGLYLSPLAAPTATPVPTAILFLNDLARIYPTPVPSQGPIDPSGALPIEMAPSFPCATPPAPCASLYQNLSVYAVDTIPTPGASPAASMIGVFDSNN